MHTVYNLVSGPLAWMAFAIFAGGSLFRLIHLIVLVHKKEPFIYTYMSLKYSLRSIFHWIIPFAAKNWRNHPVLTVVTFLFHGCLFLVPVFLFAHVILWDEAFNIRWWALPDSVAIFMTGVVIGGCAFFLVRRLVLPEVKYVTSVSDYVILAIVSAPFLTGFLSYFQWSGYELIMVLHIISGEIMLIAIPFTRLSHMLISPLTRAYMGSEFGGVRHARDW